MRFTCVDSFSGAGGLSIGLSRAGFEIILAFDNDKLCVETQLRNPRYFNHQVLCSGIDEMLGGGLLKQTGLKPGELDLLAGGPPCQGFSVQRIGADVDDRNDLVLKFVQLVEEMQPKFFLMENVRGLAGKRGREYLSRVLRRAEQSRYHVHLQVLDAQDFDVPQRRKRVVVVGERQTNDTVPQFSFPEVTTPKGNRITVRMAIGKLPPPPQNGVDHPEHIHHRRDRLSPLNKKRLAALKEGQGREHLPQELLADCHQISSDIIGHRNVYGRMRWDDVAPTITARFDSFTRGLFGHPSQLRSISLREGAELQTFPSDMIFAGNKVDIARQIGNAVPVNFAEAIGKSIAQCLRVTKQEEER
ncbi:MAG TPA: modification methylase HgiDII [Deltaproteobacteria bacterium]|nr:modification methylase HgiDII [Deltaproteobacteria bacterium]